MPEGANAGHGLVGRVRSATAGSRLATFPDELPELIRYALGSLQRVEQNGRYRVDMKYTHWGHPRWAVWNVTSLLAVAAGRCRMGPSVLRDRTQIFALREATRQHDDYGYVCTVGWAGAVMTTTFGVPARARHPSKAQWGPMIERRLDALEALARTRDVFRALAILRLAICHFGTNHYTNPVGESPDGILKCDCGLTRLRRRLTVDYPDGLPAYDPSQPQPFYTAMDYLAKQLATYARAGAVGDQFVRDPVGA